jgi:DNA helicase-2/ATP-dependent DNA helicase PcrA
MEIAFFSFSVTAVSEGLDRITKRMETKYVKSHFKYFKTLHAMAFYLLGLSVSQVIDKKKMKEFSTQNNYRIQWIDNKGSNCYAQTEDTLIYNRITAARLQGTSIRDYFVHHGYEGVTKAETMAAQYEKFKIQSGYFDYTDMILLANKQEFDLPHFKYMFIDEAQDLSKEQWFFVDKLAKNADKIIIVGDERQAIAEFAGADVDTFLNIKGNITTLSQSYRVPRAVWKLARKIEKKMIKTRNAEWKPRPREYGEETNGEVIYVNKLPVRELARGSWLILTRTNAQLQEFKEYLMQNCNFLPTFFTVNGYYPIDLDVFRAIDIFEATNELQGVTKYDLIMPDPTDSPEKKKIKKDLILLFKRFITAKSPYDAELDSAFEHRFRLRSWVDAFDKVPLADKRYILTIRDRYKKHPDSFSRAKIRLSTIHSAKGSEADNVILYTSISKRVYDEWQASKDTSDTEMKVLFVGVTRARKRLFLLSGSKNNTYSYDEVLK